MLKQKHFAEVLVGTRDLLAGENFLKMMRIEQHRLEKPLANYLQKRRKFKQHQPYQNISKVRF